ncbi:MAG: anti-sigma factor antagonist [Nostocaceae cyanobacterium]|nr:anti-sigma factor antagonist [Nostocaceae cyanobacterium]
MVTTVQGMDSQPQELNFPVKFLHETAIVQVAARLSVIEAVTFKQTCQQLIQGSSSTRQIIIDFHQTTFMDSSGLGALVTNFKAAQERGIEMILQNVTPQVRAVLSLTGLEDVFQIEVATPTPQTSKIENQLPTTHPSVRSWMKRLIDIVGSLVGLVITAILFIPIAIAIQISDPGPIFFSQTRCGWMGKPFKIWKFRSMVVDAEARKSEVKNQYEDSKLIKAEDDPRITKVGRLLRKTSLDELPQFWNVLKGEMSLVGTRPPTPDEVERYEVPEWQRLDVKPGMTGEWQVKGRSTVKRFEDVIALDLEYQKNWSLLYDLQLIFRTVTILFNKNSGAL